MLADLDRSGLIVWNTFFTRMKRSRAESAIAAYAENGGIIGRGNLIDWVSWAQRNNQVLSRFQAGAIQVEHLQAIVAENNIENKPGDILFIRCGFTAAFNELSISEQQGFPNRQPGADLGFEATKDSLRWLWNCQFSAVASDSASLARGPATGVQ